jgi:hypothetical protein
MEITVLWEEEKKTIKVSQEYERLFLEDSVRLGK